MRLLLGVAVSIAALCACGGATVPLVPDGGGGDDSGSSGGSGSSSGGASSGSGSGSSSGGSSGGSGSSSGGSSGGSGSSSGGSGSSSGGSGSGSSSGGPAPQNHRPSDAQCQTVPATGTCNMMGTGVPGMCSSDSQCTSGVDGRCVISGGGALYCSCTYDTCMHDTDCPTGQTCACHGSAYVGGDGNSCVPGNCRVDADCGAGGYCSPSFSLMGCGGLAGYYCHTPKDACINDSDCGANDNVCVYDAAAGYWECKMALLCG